MKKSKKSKVEQGGVILKVPPCNEEIDQKEQIEQGIQFTYWCFTYNNYEKIELLEGILKSECDWYVFQEEVGENNTPHLQGVLKLKKKQRLTALKKICPAIHWENTKSIKASIIYCTKKETSTGKIYSYGFEIPEEIEIEEPRGWQLEVMDIIKNKPDKRTINWFWERTGGTGKSELTKYLVVKHKAILVSGKGNDIKHALMKENNIKIVIIDVPRVALDYISYSAIEEVKNGIIFSGKYDSGYKVFNSPHIIVFGNEPPHMEKLSKDRWNVRKIDIKLDKTTNEWM